MAEVCVPQKKNLGLQLCKDLPSRWIGMITTSMSFKFTAAESIVAANWIAALIDDPDVRIHKYPPFKGVDDQSTEPVYESNPWADNFVTNGKYSWRFHFIESLCTHKALFTHSGDNQRAFLVDAKKNIYGMTDDGTATGNFQGFTLSLANLENIKVSDGTVPSFSPFKITLLDSEEFNASGARVNGSTFYSALSELIDVNVELSTPPARTTSSIHVTVKTDCDGTAVSGLVAADFEAFTSAGVPIVIATAPYADGVYNLTSAAAFVALMTINIKVPASLSIKLYESLGAVTVPSIP